MSDLINRQDAINLIIRVFKNEENLYTAGILVGGVVNIPTVEAVPVVRCKDCKHWGTGIDGETERVKCCEYGRYMVGENGYCVYGEKKE